jgi:hypothetical protein
MHVRLVEVTTPELAEILPSIPPGRLHASGEGFLPHVKDETYSELAALTTTQMASDQPALTADALPGNWDDVAPGHLVLVHETPECGWWEAVVIERNGDLVTLRYRDYPQYPALVRHRSAVALIGAPAP